MTIFSLFFLFCFCFATVKIIGDTATEVRSRSRLCYQDPSESVNLAKELPGLVRELLAEAEEVVREAPVQVLYCTFMGVPVKVSAGTVLYSQGGSCICTVLYIHGGS